MNPVGPGSRGYRGGTARPDSPSGGPWQRGDQLPPRLRQNPLRDWQRFGLTAPSDQNNEWYRVGNQFVMANIDNGLVAMAVPRSRPLNNYRGYSRSSWNRDWQRGEQLPPQLRQNPLTDWRRFGLTAPSDRNNTWFRVGDQFVMANVDNGLVAMAVPRSRPLY